jgi:hypothetical protein
MSEQHLDLIKAMNVVRGVVPGHNPEFTCMLVASAIAGIRGYGMGQIRIGALAHRTKFNDQPYLAMRGGWGLEGMDAQAGKIFLAAEEVDQQDGGFNGHTWIEPEPDTVLDLMHGVEDGAREEYDNDFRVVGRYIPRLKLERAVKRFWRPQMLSCIKMGKMAR